MKDASVINVGVIGLGMMGSTHLDVYAKLEGVRVLAISDANPARLSGQESAGGNIEGQSQGGIDLSMARKYADGMELIADADVDLVDICLPTPLHRAFGEAALAAGKHVLIEKPLARTSEDAEALVEAAANAKGLAMPGMCMRFWPGWDWLAAAVAEGRYGAVRSAHFRRVTSHPGGPFYSDGEACGGALLDLHIHDTDFIQHCFGVPEAVSSRGYSVVTGRPDHVMTQYHYGQSGPMVSAEGGWAMAEGFGFEMQYTVNFEKATAVFDLAKDQPLKLIQNGKAEAVELPAGMGYEHEIRYFIDCITQSRSPQRVTLRHGLTSVQIVEAEARSIASGKPEAVSDVSTDTACG